jgi:hypothetical protein
MPDPRTTEGVGWISQVQLSPTDPDYPGRWLSWQQWKGRDVAVRHATKLLERPDFVAARVIRVDWTIVEEIDGK